MHGTEVPPEKDNSGIDLQAALEMAGGDVALLRDLADAFVSEVPQLLRALRTAIEDRNVESLQATAHQLQGVMRCLHIEGALQQARQLELAAEGISDWLAIMSQVDGLNVTIDSALLKLNAFLNEQA